jgi:hypothetical protein
MTRQAQQSGEKRFLKRLICDQSGAVAVWFVIMLPIFLGVTALAIDMSYAMMMRQRLQITASSAALAGAKGLATSNAQAVTLANDYANVNLSAYGDVLRDVDISLGTVDMVSVPRGDFVAGGTPPNAVRVTTRLANSNNNPLQLFFASIAGIDHAEIDTTATAISYRQPPPDACLIALNETSTEPGLTMSGNGTITGDGCGICVNSTSPDDSLHLNGTPDIDVGGDDGTLGAILVAGEYYEAGAVYTNPEPTPNQDTVEDGNPLCDDPFKDITDYDLPANICDPVAYPGPTVTVTAGTVLLNPTMQIGVPIKDPETGAYVTGDRLPAGIHCNLDSFEGGTSVEFGTGIHWIRDTELVIHGLSGLDTFVSSEEGGVTFVMSGSDLQISNGAEFYFEALPDENGDPGLLFWQDPYNPNPNPPMHISGGQYAELIGTVYLGQEDLELYGSIHSGQDIGEDCLSILAGTFLLGGGPDIDLTTSGCGSIAQLPPNALVVRLVE